MAIVEIAALIFLLQGISCKVIFPKDGFKFNCGSDICIFPIQYCDVVDGVCKYCSEDVCNAGDVPSQCYTQCSATVAPVEVSNTPPSLSSKRSQTSEDERFRAIEEQLGKQWTFFCVLVGLGILIVVLLFTLIFIKCLQKQKNVPKNTDKPAEPLPRQQKQGEHIELDVCNSHFADSSSSGKRTESRKRNENDIENADTEETVPLVDSSNAENLPGPPLQDPSADTGSMPSASKVVKGSPQCYATEKDENFGEYKLLEDGSKSDPCGFSGSRKTETSAPRAERSVSRESKSEDNLKLPVMEVQGSQNPDQGTKTMVVNGEVHDLGYGTGINKMSRNTNTSEDSGHFSYEETVEKGVV